MLTVLKSPFYFLLNDKINFNTFFMVEILFTKNRQKIQIFGLILKENVFFEDEIIFFNLKRYRF